MPCLKLKNCFRRQTWAHAGPEGGGGAGVRREDGELREMYRTEMDSQNEKYEAEKAKMRMLETSLQVNCFVQPVVPTLT